MSTNRPILRVDNLKVDFPIFGGLLQRKINSVHAVRGVDFELFKGETLGIVGESGSGKPVFSLFLLGLLNLRVFQFVFDLAVFRFCSKVFHFSSKIPRLTKLK